MLTWLKHAFAVDASDAPRPTLEQADLIERLARGVVRRGLSGPAIMALECSHNLNFLASQTLVFFQPIISVLFKEEEYRLLTEFLERRGSVEYLCRRIEHHVDESRAGSPGRDGTIGAGEKA